MMALQHIDLLRMSCGLNSPVIYKKCVCTPHFRQESKWSTFTLDTAKCRLIRSPVVILITRKVPGGAAWPTVGMTVRTGSVLYSTSAFTWFLLLITENIFVSFQISLASVDNYMLIITQHNTASKTDSTANTTVI